MADTVPRRHVLQAIGAGSVPAPTFVSSCSTNVYDGVYLTFDEDKKGSLEAGKLADLAVLSADPLTVEENAIADIRSLLTVVGGWVVHEAPNWQG